MTDHILLIPVPGTIFSSFLDIPDTDIDLATNSTENVFVSHIDNWLSKHACSL